MRNLYVDLRHPSLTASFSGVMNGGGNYLLSTPRILLEKKRSEDDVILLCDGKAHKNLCAIFEGTDAKIRTVSGLSELRLEADDIYYSPLMIDSNRFASEIRAFRKANPLAKLYATIHDRRHLDILYDREDALLKDGLKRIPAVLAAGRAIHAFGIECAIRKSVPVFDKVFTVSNDSMQKLYPLRKGKYLRWFYQGTVVHGECDISERENYLLFVSGGRPEKNFLRTLRAFIRYVKKSGNGTLKLKCTGLNPEQISRIRANFPADEQIISKQVEFCGYVSNEELRRLYARCRFLLFTSKSEGFGLPVLEAVLCGTPVLASARTATPEVAGACCVYADPYDADSICRGIETLMDDRVYDRMRGFILRKREILISQIKLDEEILAYEILN